MDGSIIVPCAACGTKNRVPREKLEHGQQPVCGKCKAPLRAGGAPVIVTDATFTAEVERAPMPVLVDLWAQWCGPCRMLSPVLEELAAEMSGQVRIAKLNIDENPRTAERFQIRSIPALLFFQGGREVDRMVGVRAKQEIANRLRQMLAA